MAGDMPKIDASGAVCGAEPIASLGQPINTLAAVAPAAKPWGYQAGLGYTMRIEIPYDGETFVVVIAPESGVKVTHIRGGHPKMYNTSTIGVLRRGLEVVEAARAAVLEAMEDETARQKAANRKSRQKLANSGQTS